MATVKKVMIVVGSFKVGGAERMAINAGQELIKAGVDVHFVLQRPIFELAHSIEQRRIHVLHEEETRSKYLFHLKSLFGVFVMRLKLRPDLVLAFTYFSSFVACFTFSRYVIGRFDIDPYSFRSKKRDRLANFVVFWPMVRRIVLPSHGLANSLAKRNATLKRKVHVIPNSINTELIRRLSESAPPLRLPFEGRPYIAAMGRLTHQKNYELLISAYSRSVINSVMGLVIIGNGSLMDKLTMHIEKCGVKGKVVMAGALLNPFPTLKASSLFVNTSNFESFCNVILEALTLSVPVVASDCDFGPSEIVEHNVNGILFPPKDIDSLVAILDKLAQNPNLLEQLAERSSAGTRKFDVTTIGQQWYDLIEEYYD